MIEYLVEDENSKVYPDILNTISNVSFDSLTMLVLRGQEIESLEALSWINCPKLVILELD